MQERVTDKELLEMVAETGAYPVENRRWYRACLELLNRRKADKCDTTARCYACGYAPETGVRLCRTCGQEYCLLCLGDHVCGLEDDDPDGLPQSRCDDKVQTVRLRKTGKLKPRRIEPEDDDGQG